MRTVLTRPPDEAIVRCELTFLERRPIDPELARKEHAGLESALAELGCRVVRLPPLPDHPDAAFVEDTAIVLDEVAIVARPGAPSRRAEAEGMAAVLAPFRPVRAITAPGTLDGGDVLTIGRTLYVGRSSRTSDDGIGQLRALVQPFGYAVVAVDLDGCLHLKTAACAASEHLVVVNPDWVDPSVFRGLEVLPVDRAEPFAAEVLPIGDVVLTAEGAPRTRRALEDRGIHVHVTPLAELAKAEAGVTCCCLVIEDR